MAPVWRHGTASETTPCTPCCRTLVVFRARQQAYNSKSFTHNLKLTARMGGEAEDGDPERARLRKASIASALFVDGLIDEVTALADALLGSYAVPEKEITDALHIATASVYAMDVLLTWNCRHMANPVTLPKTAAVVAKAGYDCPVIVTPQEFLERMEEFGYED